MLYRSKNEKEFYFCFKIIFKKSFELQLLLRLFKYNKTAIANKRYR